MNDRVELVKIENIAFVTLNRPGKFNAVDIGMIDGLVAAGEAVAADPDVRVAVLAGHGEHFCAGIDVGMFQAGENVLSPELMAPQGGRDTNYFQRPALIWRDLQVPVIAALHGICYGAGLQIALGADIRVAGPDCKLSVMEVKWGIIPDMGMSVTARGLVQPDRLKELAMTGRVLNATEALDSGLVTEISESPAGRAAELAAAIAAKSPDAVAAIKRLMNTALEGPRKEALKLEAGLQLGILGSANQIEAVTANVEKRAPVFAPRTLS